MRIPALCLVTLAAACGGGGASTKPPLGNRSSAAPADLLGAAMAADAKLNADYACACAVDEPTEAFCEAPIVPDLPEDDTLEAGGMPYLLTGGDRMETMMTFVDTCWGRLAEWEDARGIACLGRGEGTKPGPRPSCGEPPAYHAATVDEWWKQATPCPGKQQLRTSPNPMKKGALLAAWCAEIGEFDIEHANGRITTWYVSGGVSSDRGPDRRTDWYAHGQVKEDRKLLPLPPPDAHGWTPASVIAHTHFWPNGQISDKGEYFDNEMRGLWEGFRPDGTKDYTGTLKEYGDEVTWLGRDGKPVAAAAK
jgi:hypothetical protein